MKRTPNYELLKDAYAILGGIPDKVIYLNVVQNTHTRPLDCGTICCGIGWLANHPQFQELGLKPAPRSYGNVRWNGRTVGYVTGAARTFGISREQAKNLFNISHRPESKHKAVLLNRIMRLLDRAGQVCNPIYLPE